MIKEKYLRSQISLSFTDGDLWDSLFNEENISNIVIWPSEQAPYKIQPEWAQSVIIWQALKHLSALY